MTTQKDLFLIHELITDLFRWPATEKEWKALELPQEDVVRFKQDGFIGGIEMLNQDQVNELHKELDLLLQPDHPGAALFYEYNSNESADPNTVLFHALGAWRVTPGFHDVLFNPRFAAVAKQLLNSPVRFWHDQLFYKPAKKGGVVAWHQDYSYWTRTKPVAHLTCWCALDDATLENGCLQYIPGSHKWGLLPKPVIAGEFDSIIAHLTPEQREQFQHPEPVPVKAGEAIFHHPLALHGSGGNKSGKPRRAFVINAIADGVISDSDEPLLQGVPVISKGCKVEGRFFPLLIQ